MKNQNTQVDYEAPSTGVGRVLRALAEKKAWDLEAHIADSKSPKAARMLAHELRVQQIELEMQNEELHRAQAELEISRARYFNLYNLAPTGYCTLSEKGLILEANLAAATLLGKARDALVNQSFSRFIFKEDQDSYYLHRKQIFETVEPLACELRMVKGDGTTFWVHLEAAVAQGESGDPVYRVILNDVTERKQAERKLRESEDRYRTLFDQSNDGITLISADGDLLSVNESFARMHGYSSAKEMLPLNLRDLDTPESSQRAPERLRRLMAGESLTFEVEHYHKDGHIFPLEVSGSLNTCGEKSFLQCLHRDITERKRVGEALQESETLLKEAQRIAGLGSYVLDLSTELWRGSDVLHAILGVDKASDHSVEGWLALIHPDDRAMVSDHFRNDVLGRKQVFNKEYRIIRHDDQEERWLCGLGRLEFDAQGCPLKLYGTVQDITERKQAEEDLRASESRYRRLFESAQDGILILDAESGRVRDVNPFLITLLGYTRGELIGRQLSEIGAFGDTQKSWDEFRQLQIEEYVRYEDMPLVRKDGTLFEVEVVSNVYLVDDRKVIQCNIHDITERRMMENTLRFLAQGTGAQHGENFFQTLARYLAEALNMDFVCIDRLDGDGLTARTVAVWCDGEFEDNVVYALKDTPCGEVVGKTVCCFSAGVCRLFPRDAVLQDLRADSYVGATLWSHTGHPIGLIAVIGRKPLSTPNAAESVLKLVAVRAASELEREQSDAAIRDISLLPQQNPSPILRVGADGRLQYANLNADPLLLHWDGIEIGDTVPPQIAAAVTKALTSGSAHEIEIAFGSRHLSFILAPIRSYNYVNLYGRDITTLKHAQAREKEAKAFAAASQTAVTILESMGEAVLLLTMDGYVKSVNPALEKMIGIPARELIGQTLRSFFPKILADEEYKIVEAALADVLCGEMPAALPSLTLMNRNGQRIPVIPAVSFILGPNDKPAAVVITLRDISILRDAQRALEDSEQKYRELVENANSIIMRITPDHTITFFNEYAQTFFGYTDKEILGKNVRETIIPSSDSAGRDLHELLAQITENPEVYRTNENENLCKDGRRVWIHWANRAIRDDQGKVTEILCIGTDITERKKDQQAIETYQAELRALPSGLALVEEQARRQLSVALHDTVGQTLSLAKIKLGALGCMLKEKEPKAALAEIREMFDAAVHQTRTLSFELSPPILYELGFAAAVEWLGEDFGKRYGFRVHFKGTDRKYEVSESVSILFFQSARELLTNIVKHAKATKVNVLLAKAGDRMVMEIIDNGKGLDPEDAGNRESLGLFSIRERMRHIGGSFEIRSGQKGGTIAKLSAPMQEPESAGTGISK